MFKVLYLIGATKLAAWWNRSRVMILGYHGVSLRDPEDDYGLHVNARRFAAQLDHLRRHYRIVSLIEYVEARRAKRSLPPRAVVLTFDDAYRNFLSVAAPLLRARGMTATVYVITDEAARAAELRRTTRTWTPLDDDEYLSWDEIRELRAAGFDFDSHTCSHPRLSDVSPAQAHRELEVSRRALSEQLGREDFSFAYPCGKYTPEVVGAARRLGYTCAVTCDRGLNDDDTDLFMLRRTLIGNEEVSEFAAHVSGLASLLRKALPFAVLPDRVPVAGSREEQKASDDRTALARSIARGRWL